MITGACGYIGANLIKVLRNQGISSIALDNLSTGALTRIPEDTLFIKGDIRDSHVLRDIFKEYQISTVINLAGLKSPNESFDRPGEYFEVNAAAVKLLLEQSKRFGVSAFIQSSSSSVYGNSKGERFFENSKRRPISPYGESKKMAEQYLSQILAGSSTRGISLRYFNVVGALDKSLQDFSNFNLFPKTIEGIKRSESPVIFGTDYPTPDGTCIRDYIHVGDLVEGHILVAKKIIQSELPSALNLGLGRGYSVREIIELIVSEMNMKTEVIEMGRRNGDPAIAIADTSLFESLFEWRPKFSLMDMVRTSI